MLADKNSDPHESRVPRDAPNNHLRELATLIGTEDRFGAPTDGSLIAAVPTGAANEKFTFVEHDIGPDRHDVTVGRETERVLTGTAPLDAEDDPVIGELNSIVGKTLAMQDAPQIGEQAALAIRRAAAATADDVERVAQEHVDRAVRLQVEAFNMAADIRARADVMAHSIEEETLRGAQVSFIMRKARDVISQGQEPPAG